MCDHRRPIRLWVYFPVLFAILLVIPRLIFAQFGLLDDGITLQNTRQMITSGSLSVPFDLEAGRFRPVYWIYYTLLSLLARNNPVFYYLGNLLLLAGAVGLLILLVLRLGGSQRQAWITGLIFCLSGPVIENYYTLSKAEPIQIIFLLLSLLAVVFACRQSASWEKLVHFVIACVAIFSACASKETALVLIPISLLWLLLSRLQAAGPGHSMNRSFEKIFFWSSVAGSAAFVSWRWASLLSNDSGTGYTQKFQLGLMPVLSTALRWSDWLIRDFAYLVPLFIFLALWVRLEKKQYEERHFVYPILWMVGWLGVYLPWLYTSEYYLLPFSLGMAFLSGAILNLLWDSMAVGSRRVKIAGWSCLIPALLLFGITLAINYTNGRIQLTSDVANARLVQFLASKLPANSLILVNFPEKHEYIQGIGLHLVEIGRRDDLTVQQFTPERLTRTLAGDQRIFIVKTEVYNTIKLSTRLGIYEEESTRLNRALDDSLNTSVTQVYWDQVHFRSFYIDLPFLFCTFAKIPRLCMGDSPGIDRRNFTYGWQVLEVNQ